MEKVTVRDVLKALDNSDKNYTMQIEYKNRILTIYKLENTHMESFIKQYDSRRHVLNRNFENSDMAWDLAWNGMLNQEIKAFKDEFDYKRSTNMITIITK